uniref:Homeobox domain-containing protein n=1 Tax=Sarcophilus harrisii TaxID=9305 RepID=A0A7N4NSI2_SARHA
MNSGRTQIYVGPHYAISPATPTSVDMFVQDIPDSATSPTSNNLSSQNKPKIHQGKEDQNLVKKSKMRTVFSQAQLNVLNSRFLEQKYLSPQQIRNVAENLNLTYKQVKTWFQNQRMKSKRWQKDSMWSKNSNNMVQVMERKALSFQHNKCFFRFLSIYCLFEVMPAEKLCFSLGKNFLLMLYISQRFTY